MSGKTNVYVSIIVPVFNEELRMRDGLRDLICFLQKQTYVWEIIVVDDGSEIEVETVIQQAMKDGVVPRMVRKNALRVLRLDTNRGKGAAIACGVKDARGNVVVFTDVDMSVPVSMLSYVLKKLKQFPVVIASRRHPNSVIAVHQSFVRETSGRVFTALARWFLGLSVTDVTCGMKGYRIAEARTLFGYIHIDRWVFDAEVLFLAKKFGFAVREIAVEWKNKSGSKVRAWETVGSFIDLMKIRWYDAQGRYEKT